MTGLASARRWSRFPRGANGTGGDASDWLLVGSAGLLGVAVVLWLGAVTAAVATSGQMPHGGLVPALLAISAPLHPGSVWPSPHELPGPVGYWSISCGVVVAISAATWAGARAAASATAALGIAGRARSLRALPGLATVAEVHSAAGRRTVLTRGAVVRPSLTSDGRTLRRLTPSQVGYRLGRLGRRELWCSVEDSVLLLGPPRMGKGMHVVIPWVLDAPGAVVATSTRPDTLAVTMRARARRGPVAVFDPQRLAGLPQGLRWSPVRGCEVARTALVRARGLAAGVGWGSGLSDSAFWAGQTEATLRCLLHAAALDGRRAGDLYRWSLLPALAEDAVSVLMRHPDAADGWADALDAAVHADPRTRDSVWLGVRQALAGLADPYALHAVDPEPGEGFDPSEFLADAGTLYVLAPAATAASSGPLIAALVEDITETARQHAARSPGARLDPPLLLALDEIANLTPLPSLPALMAEGGGTGITTLAVLQSLSQARDRWGEHAATAIWDAATVKLVLGGLAHHRDLDDISRLLGEIDEPTATHSRGRGGERSTSTSVRQMPVMPPAELRTLPFGNAVLLLRHTRPAVIDLRPWTARDDADVLADDRGHVEHAIRASAVDGAVRTPGSPPAALAPMSLTGGPSRVARRWRRL